MLCRGLFNGGMLVLCGECCRAVVVGCSRLRQTLQVVLLESWGKGRGGRGWVRGWGSVCGNCVATAWEPLCKGAVWQQGRAFFRLPEPQMCYGHAGAQMCGVGHEVWGTRYGLD